MVAVAAPVAADHTAFALAVVHKTFALHQASSGGAGDSTRRARGERNQGESRRRAEDFGSRAERKRREEMRLRLVLEFGGKGIKKN